MQVERQVRFPVVGYVFHQSRLQVLSRDTAGDYEVADRVGLHR